MIWYGPGCRVELRLDRSFGVKIHQLANLEFVFGHAWIEPSVANTPEVNLDDSCAGSPRGPGSARRSTGADNCGRGYRAH